MTDQKYRSIVERLTRACNACAYRYAFEGLIDILALLLSFVFLLWLTTALFWPAPALRVSILSAGLAALLGILVMKIIRPLVGKAPLSEIAVRLEKFYGKLQSRLIASLQLYDKLADNKENYSKELIEKTIEEAGGELRNLDFTVVVRKNRNPYKRLALAALLILFSVVVSIQTFSQAGKLYANPLANIPRPTNLYLAIDPVYSEVVKNDDVLIRITAKGEKVRGIDLNFRFEGEQWVEAPAERSDEIDVGNSVFTYSFRKLKRDVEYFARAEGIRSEVGKITILNPPRLVDVSIELDFPEYTRLQKQVLTNNDGSATAVKGTIVNFNGKLSKPVKSAVMVFDDGSRKRLSLTRQADLVSGRFTLTRSGSYHIEAEDSSGLKNPKPIEYELVCLEDYPPGIEITFPAVDIDLDEYMLIPLRAEIYDDFGFSKIEMVYWTLSEGRESNKSRQVLPPVPVDVTETDVAYDWYVEQLHLMPGDLVYYYLEVFDNDAISGPKSSVSKTYSARLPSLDEIMADITGSQEEVFREFEEVTHDQKQLKDELEELSREMLKLSEVNWDRKQQIQQALNRQKEIADQLKQLARQMDKDIEQFDRNQLATMEMLDKMEEIRRLMEQIATPELKEAMEKLQEALAKMDPEMLKQALQNFQFSVEQLNENLDRTLSLLKKFQLEQKLDTLAKLAQKLAEQQQQINESLEKASSDEDISDMKSPQLEQKQGLKSLQEQFKQAEQLNQELNMVPQSEMSQAGKMVNSEQLNEQMMQMIQSLSMCNQSGARKHGSNLEQDFKDMAQMFQQMLDNMKSRQQEMITQMLKKAISDILFLSHSQESLAGSTQILGKLIEDRRELASQQKDLESATSRVAGNVSDLTKETLFVNFSIMNQLGQALQNMQEALNNLNGRRPLTAKSKQVDAMAALNLAAMMLMNSLQKASQCDNSGTGMESFMQSLSQLGQAQQQLNQQTQSMLPIPGQSLSQMQMQGLQRLAAQQEMIRKTLGELLEEFGGGDNVLGRLNELGEEMKKVADQLRSNNADRTTIQRQERILSRLLDAQRSVNRRSYTRRRYARPGEEINRRGPGAVNLGDKENEKLAQDIKKALAEKYPRRYENMIKEYFKALAEDRIIEK